MPTDATRTLVVVAHPDEQSLTHHVVRELEHALRRRGPVEIADLAREGFDPRWTEADRRTYRGLDAAPADVLAEQRRLERATDLVLVFPVHWWSMPALLKGWVDRVLVDGWAFDDSPEGLRPRLGWLTTHVVPVAGADAALYERRGYARAIRTQVEQGIVDFCGSRRGATAFVHDSESPDARLRATRVRDAVDAVADAVGRCPAMA